MRQRIPQRHGLALVETAHQELGKPTPARNSVDTLGGGGALLVDLLGLVAAHALAPQGNDLAVIEKRHMRVTAWVFRFRDRSIHPSAEAVGIFNVIVGGGSAVDQRDGAAFALSAVGFA